MKKDKTINKTIITTDGNELGWMESFNEYNSTEYALNQEIEPSKIESLNEKVMFFNNTVALGPAIQLKSVQLEVVQE